MRNVDTFLLALILSKRTRFVIFVQKTFNRNYLHNFVLGALSSSRISPPPFVDSTGRHFLFQFLSSLFNSSSSPN